MSSQHHSSSSAPHGASSQRQASHNSQTSSPPAMGIRSARRPKTPAERPTLCLLSCAHAHKPSNRSSCGQQEDNIQAKWGFSPHACPHSARASCAHQCTVWAGWCFLSAWRCQALSLISKIYGHQQPFVSFVLATRHLFLKASSAHFGTLGG